MPMYTTILIAFAEWSRTTVSACCAGILLFVVALWAARADIARSAGLDKVVALCNVCFAVPLAVFSAEHFSSARFIMLMVPSYMPWRLFWAYFVGAALLCAALSIATKIQVRWSGLLFGIMMFLFVAMVHIPRVLANPKDRIAWVIVIREMSFGGGGWILAGKARGEQGGGKLVAVGRVLIAIACLFFGVEHFLHPAGCPGVPLEKLTPLWVPGRLVIGYLTGAILVVAGAGILAARKTRMAATYLGTWIVLLVVFIYGPILFLQLADPNVAAQIEGINYFTDTMLFAGAILAVASATPRTE